jgi:hypothetical protein
MCMEIIAVCRDNYIKHINTLCESSHQCAGKCQIILTTRGLFYLGTVKVGCRQRKVEIRVTRNIWVKGQSFCHALKQLAYKESLIRRSMMILNGQSIDVS